MVYYNENNDFVAAWLRNLISAGHVATGDVDERSIEEVRPDDLRKYDQCHFFAGIGVWSYALRLAGWPDNRKVWTGSCPCQPFSAAGKGEGFADPRHLWPIWNRLIRESCPDTVFGEQVDKALGWLDLVSGDLEGQGYAFGTAIMGAHSVGAPHIRQRLYWVANSTSKGLERPTGASVQRGSNRPASSSHDVLADSPESRRQETGEHGSRSSLLSARSTERRRIGVAQGDALNSGLQGHGRSLQEHDSQGRQNSERYSAATGSDDGMANSETTRPSHRGARTVLSKFGGSGGEINGFWNPADWLPCTDGKARPVEPVAQQMADGSAQSLGPLRRDCIKEIEEEILNHADTRDTDAGKEVQDLWWSLSEEAICVWDTRRLADISEAPILLAFLRQLSKQGWAFSQSIPREGEKKAEELLRKLRQRDPSSRSSYQRGLDEQRGRESSNSLHILSSILARHAQKAWGETFQQNASDAFPLTTGAINRVGRLRGYGNAIVAPLAKEFIAAYMECCP